VIKAALKYAHRGKAVFPLRPHGKIPLTPRGHKDASIDPETISAWWSRWPQANIGLVTGACSGVFVLDVDGEEGEASLDMLESQHERLPPTAESITGGGGRHLFFQWPTTADICNSAGRLGPGLDVRGNGGYVVVPPSNHESGKAYFWSVDSAQSPAPAPDWLLTLIWRPHETYKATSPSDWLDLLKGVREGSRNDAITRLAGKLLRAHIDPHLALEICIAWNDSRCRPPLGQEEVAKVVNSIAGRELARRGI